MHSFKISRLLKDLCLRIFIKISLENFLETFRIQEKFLNRNLHTTEDYYDTKKAIFGIQKKDNTSFIHFFFALKK